MSLEVGDTAAVFRGGLHGVRTTGAWRSHCARRADLLPGNHVAGCSERPPEPCRPAGLGRHAARRAGSSRACPCKSNAPSSRACNVTSAPSCVSALTITTSIPPERQQQRQRVEPRDLRHFDVERDHVRPQPRGFQRPPRGRREPCPRLRSPGADLQQIGQQPPDERRVVHDQNAHGFPPSGPGTLQNALAQVLPRRASEESSELGKKGQHALALERLDDEVDGTVPRSSPAAPASGRVRSPPQPSPRGRSRGSAAVPRARPSPA